MKCPDFMSRYRLNEEKALAFGFTKEGASYVYRHRLTPSDFIARVIIEGSHLSVSVYEESLADEYLLFNLPDPPGAFVANLHEEVNVLLEEIRASCFESADPKERILKFVKEEFGSSPEAPWPDSPDNLTLKTAMSKKWYAVLLKTSRKSVDLDGPGNLSLLNLKADPEKIQELLNQPGFLPAYHMNKTHWLSIQLKPDMDFALVAELLKKSYALVERKA